MPHAVTTSQAAERLEVPLSTLKAWLERLDLPLPVDSRGRRLLDDGALDVLRTVRALRDSDLGYDTIRRKLSAEGVPVGLPSAGVAADMSAIAGEVRAAVHQAMAEQTWLAQAYGESTREIGRLEARVAALEGQLAARDAEHRAKDAALRLSAEAADDEAAHPQAPSDAPDAEPARPSWKFW